MLDENKKPLFESRAPKRQKPIQNEVTEYALDSDDVDDESFLFDDD